MSKKQHKPQPGRKPVRSDIPYRDRLLMDRCRTIADHRDDSAITTLKVACVALNDTEGLGFERILRFAQRFQILIEQYYANPEQEGVHLDERLRKIGFLVQDGRVLVARDENGRAMKVRETNA